MNLRSNNVKVALTVLGAILIAFFGYRFMKNIPLLGPGNGVAAVFATSEGLAPGRAVNFRGVSIGTIRSVTLLPSDSVRIEMNIDEDIVITEGSFANIRSADLLGTMMIEIIRGESNTPLPPNSTIKGVIEVGGFSELTDLGTSIGQNAVVSTELLNSILARADSIMDAQMQRDIQSIASNLQKTTETLNKMVSREQETISVMLANMKQLTITLDEMLMENRAGISSVVANLDSTSASFNELSRELTVTTAEITALLEKMNKGEGTLGKLANDQSLYNNLDSLAVNMSNLLKDMQSEPRRYTRGLIKIF